MTQDHRTAATANLCALHPTARYAKPTLRVYGSVVELTKGVTGSKFDTNLTRNTVQPV